MEQSWKLIAAVTKINQVKEMTAQDTQSLLERFQVTVFKIPTNLSLLLANSISKRACPSFCKNTWLPRKSSSSIGLLKVLPDILKTVGMQALQSFRANEQKSYETAKPNW